jgi:hypothetical protein
MNRDDLQRLSKDDLIELVLYKSRAQSVPLNRH